MKFFNNGDIKNIIFDLGNVLIETDIRKTILEFEKLGVKEINKILIKEEFYFNFEKGLISKNDFREKVCTLCSIKISDKDFDCAWNKMLISIADEKNDILSKIKNHFKILVLSNTNIIHAEYFEKQLYWKNELFDDKFYSHEIGLRKPDEKIFEYVISKSNILPQETVFIDDRDENINAAKKMNFKTVLFKNITLSEIFQKFI